MIKVYNRKTNKYEVEKVAGEGFLEALYGTTIGKIGLELMVKRKLYSSLSGWYCDRPFSAKKIKNFAESFGINMEESLQKTEEFKTFNDFFIRKLKPEARPFEEAPEMLLCPGDGRLKAWENIDTKRVLQIKGSYYDLVQLLGDKGLAERYEGGTCVLLRLAPIDYHRFHFIDKGVGKIQKKIKGHYYSVNPIALKGRAEVFCQNKREITVFESENFGRILYVEVGATSVGSIIQTFTEGKTVSRGEEKGYFKFGGSTILLFFEKGKVTIDPKVLALTEEEIETRVLAGECIGHKRKENREDIRSSEYEALKP